jgi:hypothetical protein
MQHTFTHTRRNEPRERKWPEPPFYGFCPMTRPITERLADLRKEIAQPLAKWFGIQFHTLPGPRSCAAKPCRKAPGDYGGTALSDPKGRGSCSSAFPSSRKPASTSIAALMKNRSPLEGGHRSRKIPMRPCKAAAILLPFIGISSLLINFVDPTTH